MNALMDERLVERRRDIRINPGARTVAITLDDRSHPFVLNNISSRGASGRCVARLTPGTKVAVTFENGASFDACVRWEQAGINGLEFLQRLPPDQIVRTVRTIQPRAPRIAVSRCAQLEFRNVTRKAMIWNVSEHGMMIQAIGSLQVGEVVDVTTGTYRVRGTVRWTNAGYAGVKLFKPLDLGQFEADSTPATCRRAARLDA